MRRPGLRTRVTAGFAAGALVLSGAMAFGSQELTRRSLLHARERISVRTVTFDAGVVDAGLAGDNPDIIEILRSLDTGANRRALLSRGGKWYARNADTDGPATIPVSLQKLVGSGHAGVQRIRTGRNAALVIGVPLSAGTAFYEIDSLAELDHAFQVLAWILALVAMCTTAAGGIGGWYSSRRVLRPLRQVADAAEEITAGDLKARLEPTTDPDLRRLSASFNAMIEQLSQRTLRDRRFAADVSHELRSPLQTLSAASSVLTRRADALDARSATAIALLDQEVQRFQTLVTDLIELARSDAPPDIQETDMAEVARKVCGTRGLDPALVHVDGDSVWAVDARRMEQVLANLVDNAARHGGGPIAISMGSDTSGVFLEVDDDGPGVDPADRETIFDRFVRGRSAGARGADTGTGLGLALVAEHVAAHHGRVFVADRPGGGARFRVDVPVRPC